MHGYSEKPMVYQQLIYCKFIVCIIHYKYYMPILSGYIMCFADYAALQGTLMKTPESRYISGHLKRFLYEVN